MPLGTENSNGQQNTNKETRPSTTKQQMHKAVLLIQPIGVGIGRWYYDQLLQALQSNKKLLSMLLGADDDEEQHISFLAPDLLGCGTASRPDVMTMNDDEAIINEVNDMEEGGYGSSSQTIVTTVPVPIQSNLPLLTVCDWANQLVSLMRDFEGNIAATNSSVVVEWTIVANGGCVPICLEIGRRHVLEQQQHASNSNPSDDILPPANTISSLILTAPPRLSGLLMDKPSPNSTLKSYKTLCGIVGKAFWWYSLRRDGAFIQKFSVKNLAAHEDTLGEQWLPKCVETARSMDGYSRFSTFSFLSGSLQGGCAEALDVLRGKLPIYVIRGRDTRKNPTRSWFWARRQNENAARKKEKNIGQSTSVSYPEISLSEFLKQNGNDGTEKMVRGRRCVAHEDAQGFGNALIDFISMDKHKSKHADETTSKNSSTIFYNLGTWQLS